MILLLLSATLLTPRQVPIEVTLEGAASRAILVSPRVAAAEGAIRIPRGVRAETRLPFPSNPSFDYGRARRRSPSSTVFDREWAFRQEIEIAGQWLFRSRAAGKLVSSAEALVTDVERRAGLDTRLAYLDLAIAERQVTLTDSNAVFAERLALFADRQLDAGEINRIEHNAAVLEAARTRSTADRAVADRQALAAELGRLLGLGVDSTPTTSPLPAVPELDLSEQRKLVTLARARRADLTAARLAREGAAHAVTAAKLSFIPNLTFSVFGGREDATDNLFGFGVGFTVPLFRRGQSITGRAAAEQSAAHADLVTVERAIQTEVQAATQRYVSARAAERRFATGVLRAATENVTLTETALAEGEVSLTDVVVLRTAAVGAQLEYLEVLADATAAWFELAAALNTTPAEVAGLLNAAMERP